MGKAFPFWHVKLKKSSDLERFPPFSPDRPTEFGQVSKHWLDTEKRDPTKEPLRRSGGRGVVEGRGKDTHTKNQNGKKEKEESKPMTENIRI